MNAFLLVIVICGIILFGVVGLYYGVDYFNNKQNNSDVEQTNSKSIQNQTTPTPTIRIFNEFHVPPKAPKLIPSTYTVGNDKLNKEELDRYNEQKVAYDEALKKYNEAKEKYTVTFIETVSYGGMTIKTDELELQIHKLINEERTKHNLKPLDYDYQISNIAHSHSLDMSLHDYFDHTDSEGKSPAERGYLYGYNECGDSKTIQLIKEYDQLSQQFKATGNTDVSLHDQLVKLNSQINSAIQQGMVFGGLSENIFQIYLYAGSWGSNGVVVSYDWNSPDKIVSSAVAGWMNSTDHRKNILTAYYESEGIGVEINQDSKVFVTQNFC